MVEERTIHTTDKAKGTRIDLYLTKSQEGSDLSRSRIQELIRQGQITVDGKRVKPHHKLLGEEEVRITIPDAKPLNILPAAIPIPVLYEDQDLIVVNKPAGMVVHPAPGNQEKTLVNALLHHCKDLSGIGGVERPGIVHRLDKDTSGVMVAVKNDAAHHSLSAQIKARRIKKIYWAVVKGVMKTESGIIEAQIGRHEQHRKKMTVHSRRGRDATTHYHVLERFEENTLVKLKLMTGRTHQIRVHLSHIHHPIVGDPVYGGKHCRHVRQQGRQMTVNRQMLFSRILGFQHPRTDEYVEFEAETPADMQELLDFLRR